MTTAEDLVWYVSYGSNTDPRRFAHYLAGGRPVGGRRAMRGARDPSPARDHRPVWLPHRLHFAERSTVWGGGLAFIDLDATEGVRTPAVGHLVTVEQFEDVVAQENGRETVPLGLLGAISPGRDDRVPGPVRILGRGRYDALVHCGTVEGHHAVSFTAPTPRAQGEPAAPAPAYVATIGAGLRSVVGLTVAEVVDHLLAAPGVTPTWDAELLAAAVSAGPEGAMGP